MVPVASAGYGLQNALYYIAGLAVPVFFMVNGALLLNKADLGYRYVSKKIANILVIVFAWNVLFFLEKLLLERTTTDPAAASLRSFVQGDYFWQFWFFRRADHHLSVLLPLIHKLFRNSPSGAHPHRGFYRVMPGCGHGQCRPERYAAADHPGKYPADLPVMDMAGIFPAGRPPGEAAGPGFSPQTPECLIKFAALCRRASHHQHLSVQNGCRPEGPPGPSSSTTISLPSSMSQAYSSSSAGENTPGAGRR